MYATEAFERLPQEKKQRIIDVCIRLFAEYGYDATSTDQIVQEAGISKGILFHYFGSKKNLYLYIVRYANQLLTDVVMKQLDVTEGEDFFERIKRLIAEKHREMIQYHHEAKLCTDALMNPPKAVAQEMEALLGQHMALYASTQYRVMYPRQLIAEERLRPGVTADAVIEMTRMIVEKVTEKYTLLHKDRAYDFLEDQAPLIQELDVYFRIIRRGIYVDQEEA